jgi:hypothetical protein
MENSCEQALLGRDQTAFLGMTAPSIAEGVGTARKRNTLTRSGHNEGSIYKRDDGRWAGVISAHGRRTFIYGKTR